ncbi:hypothetical protein K3495_g9228 [Podosphaera aphanis]|nr:hypothetical protein K3495_g9228 [Podosphaera aphanis]
MDISSDRPSEIIITQKPDKQQAVRVSRVVEKVTTISYEGLSENALDKIIDLITLPNGLDQSKKGALIRNLYPNGKVPNNIVFKVVCGLGHGQLKPSYTMQSMLLKWLIMIFDIIEDKNALSQVYSVLFNLLDTASLRPQLCHLLAMVTRRKHIRPYRVQQLMELTQKVGNESSLVGLMQVFKDFCPDFFVVLKPKRQSSVFKHPNLEWKKRLDEIQQISVQKSPENLISEMQQFREFPETGEKTNIHLSSILPGIQTSSIQDFSTELKETQDVEEFVMNLEKIRPPSQLVAVIGDSFLQQFMQLRNSEHDMKRVENWLLAFFQEQIQNSSFDSKTNLEMLQLVLEYTRFKKALPLAVLRYLKYILPSWDGLQGRPIILDLLEYTPLESFADLSESILQPLEVAILEDESVESKIALIKFYTALLNRWIINLLVNPGNASVAEPSVTALIAHANELALTTLQISNTVATASTVLKFYETTSSIAAHDTIAANLCIVLPHPEVIYSLSFTSSLSNLSRICAILSIHKNVSKDIKDLPFNTSGDFLDQQTSKRQQAENLKNYVTDLCNCFWRSEAFKTTGSSSKGCLLSPLVIQTYHDHLAHLENSLTLESLFSLSISPVTCLLAYSYLTEMEDRVVDLKKRHRGVVTQASLKSLQEDGGLIITWKTYQLGVLAYLEDKGVTGLSDLIYPTIEP